MSLNNNCSHQNWLVMIKHSHVSNLASHSGGLAKRREIMKYTIVKMSEIAKHPTMRLDARYWIKKKKKIKKAASLKLQAPSRVDNGSGMM